MNMALVEQLPVGPRATAAPALMPPAPVGVALDDCRDIALLRRGR